MDTYDFEKLLNTQSNSPISDTKKRREPTKAVTLRLPEWWINKLEKLGHRLSLDFKKKQNVKTEQVNLLIITVIYKIYSHPGERTLVC